MSDLKLAVIAGSFGLGGVLLGGLVNTLAAWRQRVAEDKRRWLADRRSLYATYLGIAASKLQEIDSLAVFLRHHPDDPMPSDEDQAFVKEGLYDYFSSWETDVQPALGEVQLLASDRVADLADRVSSALMEVTVFLELNQAFTDYYPVSFQAQDLLGVLRNAMREELGLGELPNTRVRDDPDYPWLADRPSRESYHQAHHTPRAK
jgi:hypothetical protein